MGTMPWSAYSVTRIARYSIEEIESLDLTFSECVEAMRELRDEIHERLGQMESELNCMQANADDEGRG